MLQTNLVLKNLVRHNIILFYFKFNHTYFYFLELTSLVHMHNITFHNWGKVIVENIDIKTVIVNSIDSLDIRDSIFNHKDLLTPAIDFHGYVNDITLENNIFSDIDMCDILPNFNPSDPPNCVNFINNRAHLPNRNSTIKIRKNYFREVKSMYFFIYLIY